MNQLLINTHLDLLTVNLLGIKKRTEKRELRRLLIKVSDSQKIDDYSHSTTKTDVSVGCD